MLCPETVDVVAEHFDPSLSEPQRRALHEHLAGCDACQQELAAMRRVAEPLGRWREQSVPAWNRQALRGTSRPATPGQSWSSWQTWLQWGPLMASLLLVLAFVFNMEFSRTQQGFSLAFGAGSQAEYAEALEAQRQVFEAQQALQREELQAMLAMFRQQQEDENLRLVQAALQEFGEATAESLGHVVGWFEAQRALDMEAMEANFQQILDREYQTVRSMQQLASYLQYQENLR